MTDETARGDEASGDDARLAALLRGAAPAPAERDALFRLRVMELRERRRFHRRRALIAAAALAGAAIALFGLIAGGELRTAAGGALIAMAFALTGVSLGPALARRIRLAGI